ncbi:MULTISPECIES: hypothetical protein [Bacillus amyloliquefaciens group]|uniref:hypothetical protein n=1 Tax=Bacillus amyloliquefaciens group TaxID=1938374 RepID=UPI00073C3245|nr:MULTISPECIES: hypothetical protein [Bacillus amyloliquefaciens group]KTF59859.1 hypothetical protein AR691_14105 [Bacillus amyloliquefaciens]
MKDYYEIKEVSNLDTLNNHIKDGWEIIESFADGGKVKYHIGLTKDTVIENLHKIIELYEDTGLKDVLFERIGDGLNDDINDYEETTYQPSLNPLVQTFIFYERWVNGKETMLKRKSGKERDSDLVDHSLPF